MDRETRERLAQAKTELAEVLQSLTGNARLGHPVVGESGTVIFTGSVTIQRFVHCDGHREAALCADDSGAD